MAVVVRKTVTQGETQHAEKKTLAGGIGFLVHDKKGTNMKKLGVGAAAVLLLVSLGSSVASAEVTWGAGYQAMFLGELLQGASIRAWVDDKWGIEGNIMAGQLDVDVETTDYDDPNYNSEMGGDGDLYVFSGKVMYAPVVKENSKFYFGFEVGYGTLDLDVDYTSSISMDGDVWAFGPLFGAEYRFQEMPELGFNWEVGYRFGSASADGKGSTGEADLDLDISGITVCLGVHYYFK